MRLFPDVLNKSTYDIDYRYLYEKGYRGLIYDIDNTLVEHNEPADNRSKLLCAELKKMGYKICVVSNNKEPRVRAFAKAIGCSYVYKAGKPLRSGYDKAMKIMGTGAADTLVIGDQLFTDIWGANNAGLRSIMVKRIAFHEEIQIHLKRIPESLIVFIYTLIHRKNGIKELL
ncbi:MAG: YqeG family HAD IIIA-type phosphatase [Lachnospiraceae bacterium]|nr:YqeG family HAD IIIA-type phosphatase [Lachnospiraceae bacterium]